MRTLLEQRSVAGVPLAARMRPKTLADFVGQEQVMGPHSALRRMIEAGQIGSLLLWGPPGVGKTTLAYIIADSVDAKVERVSAVTAGVKDLRAVIERAAEWRQLGHRTVLIVDEIHRFNKAQQDVLLPVVEEGLITLIGATTENPYFEVIAALVSRVQIIRLEKLSEEALRAIVRRALIDQESGLGGSKKLAAKAEDLLLQLGGGDARHTLMILESAYAKATADKSVYATAVGDTSVRISEKDIQEAAQRSAIVYDKAGDAHYDTISAFIKSLRGSDPDAALFYLFRMLKAGEDPKFIMRRMLIFASEDIGNADPHALMVATSAAQTLEWVGLPEAEFCLAHAALYLAAAPKSNSVYLAKEVAKADVERYGNEVPPPWITNAPIEGLKQFGKGVGYKYPHDFSGHVVAQQYRPDKIQGHIYYEPGDEGFEKEVKRRVEQARLLLHPK